MGCGEDGDGVSGSLALRYKNTLSNILICFFLSSERTFRHLWQLSQMKNILSYSNSKRIWFILELSLNFALLNP